MNDVLWLWSFFAVAGLVALPKTIVLFQRFPDGGWPFSRILGWLGTGYIAWLAASLRLTDHTRVSIIVSMIIVLLLPPSSALQLFSSRGRALFLGRIGTWLRKYWWKLVLHETAFLSLLGGYSLVRAYRPEISGAEKMMDYAFLSVCLRADMFPPPDPWFAGGFLNYYYFGYYLWSVVLKMTGISPEIGYNLAVAATAAMTLVLAVSLARYLTASRRYAILGGLAVAVFGNFDVLRQFVAGTSLHAVEIWSSSRVIDKTINEFPAFSFLFADLHGHVMALPIVLTVIALSLLMLVKVKADGTDAPSLRTSPSTPLFVTVGWLMGILLMTNIWDVVIYAGLVLLVLLNRQEEEDLFPAGEDASFRPFQESGRLILSFVAILAMAVLTSLPFLVYYEGEQQGIRLVKEGSGFYEFMIHYGFFVIVLAFFWFWRGYRMFTPETRARLINEKTMFVLLFSLVVVYTLLKSWVLITLFLLLGLQFLVLFGLREFAFKRTDVLILAGIGLLVLCEFVYIKDFYGGQPRMNTVFKFGYQAWVLLALAIAPMSHEAMRLMKQALPFSVRLGVYAVSTALIVVVLLFPVFGTWSYSFHFKQKPTLDGIDYIRRHHPADLSVIEWLREKDRIVILCEAPGDSYQYHSVYSTFSGNVTVLGWKQHEALWRDWSWKLIQAREAEVDAFYRAEEAAEINAFCDRYNLDYIIVGPNEEIKYGNGVKSRMRRHFTQAFSAGNVTVFDARS